MKDDYYRMIRNKPTGLPSGHRLMLGKMIKGETRKITTPLVRFSRTVAGKVAIVAFAFGFVSVVFYNKIRYR